MSTIEWTDETWNPVVGCTPVSSGCLNCYAAPLAKRPERMAEYLSSFSEDVFVDGVSDLTRLGTAAGRLLDGEWIWGEGKRHRTKIEHFIGDAHQWDDEEEERDCEEVPWPLPNVWLGTSVEDQTAAENRIPHLLNCPAAVRFLSCEPLLGPLKLRCQGTEFSRRPIVEALCGAVTNGIDWVIVGGESGPHSRPCQVAWVRSVVEQCALAKVPVFVKQLGRNVVVCNDSLSEWPRDGDGLVIESTAANEFQGDPVRVRLLDPKGGDIAEWPEDLRVRDWPVVKGGA